MPRVALSLTLAAAWLAPRGALGREQLRVQAGAQLVNLGFVRAVGAAEVSGGLTDEVSEPIRSGEITLTAPEAIAAHASDDRQTDRRRCCERR